MKNPSKRDVGRLLDFASEVAREAGDRARELLRKRLVVDSRKHHDVKLEADRTSERVILEAIGRQFPGHAVMSEEAGCRGPSDAELVWVVDPLDGTANFARGLPHYSVSMGCLFRGQPLAGVVYDPSRGELCRGSRFHAATLNGERVKVRPTARIDEALVLVGFGNRVDDLKRDMHIWRKIVFTASKSRSTGSAALDMVFVASGRADGYLECGISPWDVTAGAAIVRAAGGRVRLMHFDKLRFDVVATNAKLHSCLRRFMDEVHGPPTGQTLGGVVRQAAGRG